LLKNSKDLEIARAEIIRLKTTAEKYLGELVALRDENKELSATNVELSQAKETLTAEVAARTQENEELSASRATLASEKESLMVERDVLAKKVNVASVVRVQGFDVNGYKLKSSGKESEKNRAKTIDGLKICFTALDNEIVSPGTERFFVRIINPLGETMAIDDTGSGVLRNPNTGEEVRYTQYRDVEYNNEESNVCVNWQPDMPFNPGQYTVEVYNKGFLVGMSTVHLK
jgi:hypothetical protein